MTTTTDIAETPARGWFATRWLRFVLAVTFLTRLPLPIRGEVSPADLRASMGWYPLIGLGLGAAGWGIFLGGSEWLPATVAAALTVILLELVTGALHLDGFMDTCDGLGSGAPRERALEIMKDSRVGAMGVFGAVAIILLKVTVLAALTPTQALLPLLVGWTAARSLPIIDVTLFPYARKSGTGGFFTEGRAPLALPIALLSTLAVAYLVGHLPGLLLALAALGVTLLVQVAISRKLGGLTGDVYGMGIELAEVLVLLGAAALLG